jgi:hypothetical protein
MYSERLILLSLRVSIYPTGHPPERLRVSSSMHVKKQPKHTFLVANPQLLRIILITDTAATASNQPTTTRNTKRQCGIRGIICIVHVCSE